MTTPKKTSNFRSSVAYLINFMNPVLGREKGEGEVGRKMESQTKSVIYIIQIYITGSSKSQGFCSKQSPCSKFPPQFVLPDPLQMEDLEEGVPPKHPETGPAGRRLHENDGGNKHSMMDTGYCITLLYS